MANEQIATESEWVRLAKIDVIFRCKYSCFGTMQATRSSSLKFGCCFTIFLKRFSCCTWMSGNGFHIAIHACKQVVAADSRFSLRLSSAFSSILPAFSCKFIPHMCVCNKLKIVTDIFSNFGLWKNTKYFIQMLGPPHSILCSALFYCRSGHQWFVCTLDWLVSIKYEAKSISLRHFMDNFLWTNM